MSSDLKDRKPMRSERVPGRMFDLYEGDPTEIYVDGFSGLIGGAVVSRIDFHSVLNIEEEEGFKEPVEKRVLRLRLVMPTLQLIEAVANILKGMKESEPQLMASQEQVIQAMKKQLSRVEALDGPASSS